MPNKINPAFSAKPLDVLIIGAGISGIGCACYLQRELPGKSWEILEARATFGGTWDLFKYPGIRSDSDLYTFSYDFKPWTSPNAIASADEIMSYLEEAAEEYDVLERISYNRKVVSASWDSDDALWTVTMENSETGERETRKCRWLFGATGYYDYDEGFRPVFESEETFKGPKIHPQFWPEDFDYSGKRVAVIGSGATAVTLVPSMTDEAAHVVQVQRTPTYIMPRPKQDKLALWLNKWLPTKLAYGLTRWKNTRLQRWFYLYCQKFPDRARRLIRKANRRHLPADYPVHVHFKPPYNPWDQRLCAVPDADFFRDISAGRASIVTGHIEKFTPTGIQMKSGEHVDADAIIIATGLKLKMMGGIDFEVDGNPVDVSEHLVFKGLMLDGVPNYSFAIGYTNSSWTLKVGLVCGYLCKLLAEMDRQGKKICIPKRPEGEIVTRPLMDFGAGYVQRAVISMPKQGEAYPWEMSSDYTSDIALFKRGKVIDPALELS